MLPIFSWAQQFEAENYVVSQYGLDEGLPQSSVNDIIQTKDGYIWLATYGGLVRFDGLKFTTFNRGNTPGIIDDRIIKLFEDSDGGIWLFNELETSVLFRFKDGKVEKFPLNKKGGTVFRMYNDASGRLWLRAYDTLYLFDGNSFSEFEIKELSNNESKQIEVSSYLPIIIKNKLVFIDEKKALEIDDLSDKIAENLISVRKQPLNPESLILATLNGEFYKYINGSISKVFITEDVGERFFLTFGESKERLFAEMYSKIAIWNGSAFESFDPINGKKNLSYKGVLEDSEGNIWMGTDANGLFKLKPSAIKMIDESKGLTTASMLSLTRLNNGVALLSSNCGGVFEWREGKASISKVQKYLTGGCNWSVFQDSQSRTWIGGNGVYMTKSLDQKGTYFGDQEGFTEAGVNAMMEDSEGNIWMGSTRGIYVYNGQQFFKNYQISDGLYYQDARTLVQDSNGKIWVGTGLGLNTIDVEKNVVSKIPLTENKDGSSSFTQPYVRAIYEDANHDMWIGTYGEGLFRIRNDSIRRLTVEDGLFDNVISHIVEDRYGNFWMGSNRGITRVRRDDLNKYLDGSSDSFTYSTFDSGEGMNSAETNGGFQPSTFMDEEGKIYFPTVSGVAIVDPSKVSNNSIPPPVYIERLRSEERELSPAELVTLSYDNAFLEINYTGINFTDPGKVQFRYKMIGLNDDWIDVGNLRSAIYSKIPPGDYTFQVIAANSDGVWNNEGASFNITVIPPFWQRAWFIGIVLALIFGAGYMFYLVRTNLLREQNERQKRFTEQLIESEEHERSRIAAELHDGLGQQMLVIKNRAELAKNFIGDKETLEEQLDEIMQSAVISISDVRSMSYGLRPVHLERFGLTEAINNLLEQANETTEILWNFEIENIDGLIAKNKEINFYRVLQEAINNILKHADADEASIKITASDTEIGILIRDNGKGFDVNSKDKMVGLGLSGIQERIETLAGKLEIISEVGKGTKIQALIPISNE